MSCLWQQLIFCCKTHQQAAKFYMTRNKISVLAITCWLIGSFFLFYDILLRIFPNIIIIPLQHYFNINAYKVGIFSAAYMYIYGFMQIPAGLIIDGIGLRRAMLVSLLFCFIPVFILSMTHLFWFACLCRIMMGFGAAFAFLSCMKIILYYIPAKQQATFTGISMTIGAISGVICNTLLLTLRIQVGWKTLLYCIAGFGFLLWLLSMACIPSASAKDTQSPFTPTPTAHTPRILWQTLRSILKSTYNWRIAILCGLIYLPYAVLNDLWGQPFLEIAEHLTKSQAGFLISSVWLGWIVGSPIIGMIVDKRQNHIGVIRFLMLLQMIILCVLFYIHPLSYYLLMALAFAIGVCGASMALCYLLIQAKNKKRPVLSIGFVNTIVSITVFISLPIIGKIIQGFHGLKMPTSHVITALPVAHFERGFSFLMITMGITLILLFV